METNHAVVTEDDSSHIRHHDMRQLKRNSRTNNKRDNDSDPDEINPVCENVTNTNNNVTSNNAIRIFENDSSFSSGRSDPSPRRVTRKNVAPYSLWQPEDSNDRSNDDETPYTLCQRARKIAPRLLCVVVVLAQGLTLDSFLAEAFDDDALFALVIVDVAVVVVIGVTMATNYRLLTEVRKSVETRERVRSSYYEAPPTSVKPTPLFPPKLPQALPCLAWTFYAIVLVVKVALIVHHPSVEWIGDRAATPPLIPVTPTVTLGPVTNASGVTGRNSSFDGAGLTTETPKTRRSVNVINDENDETIVKLPDNNAENDENANVEDDNANNGTDDNVVNVRRWLMTRWRLESSEQVESVVLVVVAFAAVVFLLMILSLQTVDPSNTSRKMFLEFAASRVTFDVLDCVQLLSLTLFADFAVDVAAGSGTSGGDSAAAAATLAPLTARQSTLRNVILFFASLSLLTPAVAIADLSVSVHGLLPSNPYIRFASAALQLFLINIPFFGIRVVLSLAGDSGIEATAGNHSGSVSVFLVKNIVMIFLGIRNLRKIHRQMWKTKINAGEVTLNSENS